MLKHILSISLLCTLIISAGCGKKGALLPPPNEKDSINVSPLAPVTSQDRK